MSGLLLEFIPMKIGAGVTAFPTFYEIINFSLVNFQFALGF